MWGVCNEAGGVGKMPMDEDVLSRHSREGGESSYFII